MNAVLLRFCAPSELAGRFVSGAQEDIAQERRHQSAMPRTSVDTVDTYLFAVRLGWCEVGLPGLTAVV